MKISSRFGVCLFDFYTKKNILNRHGYSAVHGSREITLGRAYNKSFIREVSKFIYSEVSPKRRYLTRVAHARPSTAWGRVPFQALFLIAVGGRDRQNAYKRFPPLQRRAARAWGRPCHVYRVIRKCITVRTTPVFTRKSSHLRQPEIAPEYTRFLFILYNFSKRSQNRFHITFRYAAHRSCT